MLPPVPTEEEVEEVMAFLSHIKNYDIRKLLVRALYNRNLYDWNPEQ